MNQVLKLTPTLAGGFYKDPFSWRWVSDFENDLGFLDDKLLLIMLEILIHFRCWKKNS